MSKIDTGATGGGGGGGTVTSVLGTTNQVDSDGSTTTPTLSTPSTFIAPGTIAATTTVTGTRLISTIATGTAPLGVTSTTNVANLNASSLSGATFSAPGAIGGGTPSTGAFTTITGTSSATLGVNGGTVGSVALNGSTSGTATLAAPAVAGTVTNAVVLSNALTVQSPTLTVGVAGTSSGSVTLTGSTSGSCTFTAPATAGTTTNGVAMSNVLQGPAGAVGTVTYGFTGAVSTGMYLANGLSFAEAGVQMLTVSTSSAAGGGVNVINTRGFGFGVANSDVALCRDAAGVLRASTSAGTCTSTGKMKAAAFMSSGTKFTTDTGCGTVTSLTGGASAGSFVAQATGACTVVITMGDTATAPNGWACTVSNQTTANLFRQTASTTTTATISGTSVTSDVISFNCVGY